MKGQFNSPVQLPSRLDEPVTVTGPLLEVDPDADEATIVCVLVQGDMDNTDQNPVWVEGRGEWTKTSGSDDWEGSVAREGRVIGGGRRMLVPGAARGIAVAVAVREEKPGPDGKLVPPSIDTITWCVNVELQ